MFNVTLCKYSRKYKAVMYRSIFRGSYEECEKIIDKYIEKPLACWHDNHVNTAFGYLPGSLWTAAYENEHRKRG